MKILVNKIGNNSVTIQRTGFAPEVKTYTDFFEQELYEPNRYSYIDSVTYENGVIIFNKIDNEYSVQYTDEYVIDSELLNEENFQKGLSVFLENYDSKKDELNRTLEERLSQKAKYGYKWDARVEGQDFYRKYIKTGEIPYIYRDEIAIRILHNCINNPDKITSCKDSDSYYGSSIYYTVEYPENEKYATSAKICRSVSFISLIGTIVTIPVGLTVAAIPLSLTGLTGLTGLGAYKLNKTWHQKQEEINAYHIEVIKKELEQRYNYLKPLNNVISK